MKNILRQDSRRQELLYSGFIVIIVRCFQQLPPVGDKTMYTEGNTESSLLFNHIQNIVIFKKPQQQVGNSLEELKFQTKKSTFNKAPLLSNTGWICLKYLL